MALDNSRAAAARRLRAMAARLRVAAADLDVAARYFADGECVAARCIVKDGRKGYGRGISPQRSVKSRLLSEVRNLNTGRWEGPRS